MGEIVKELTWRSIHSDYLRFAVLSFYDCDKTETSVAEYLNRRVIETIRYSYDCIEASVEFIYLMGKIKQLPIEIQENWLSRQIKRKWNDLNLSDRLGIYKVIPKVKTTGRGK